MSGNSVLPSKFTDDSGWFPAQSLRQMNQAHTCRTMPVAVPEMVRIAVKSNKGSFRSKFGEGGTREPGKTRAKWGKKENGGEKNEKKTIK